MPCWECVVQGSLRYLQTLDLDSRIFHEHQVPSTRPRLRLPLEACTLINRLMPGTAHYFADPFTHPAAPACPKRPVDPVGRRIEPLQKLHGLRLVGRTAHGITMTSTGMLLTAVNGDAVGEVEICQSPDGSVRLDVRTDGDTVWLTC